jgi:hypothetical protein
VEYPLHPAAPCPYPPGSEEKLAILEARAALKLPLFQDDDAEGARQLNDVEPGRACHSHIERAIIEVITCQEVPVDMLAALAGLAPCQQFKAALGLLREAGLAERGKHGWRLAEVEL